MKDIEVNKYECESESECDFGSLLINFQLISGLSTSFRPAKS